ncbi:MAG TPA: hypothetical protein VKC54_04900 [Patescibacteria group bacterium]|nr:hypothetical protein [Patescibacteria group bacterium]
MASELLKKLPEGVSNFATINVGGKTSRDLNRELRRNHIDIGSGYRYLLKVPRFLSIENREVIDLVSVNIDKLKLEDTRPTTEDIYVAGKHLGLEACPFETIPELLIQFANKPKFDSLMIMTFWGQGGDPQIVFQTMVSKEHKGKKETGGSISPPGGRHDSDWEYVFLLP